MGYSSIVGYEVWNFMSIGHAKVSFDERGILNFKGYNDSGKSNMLRALDVCLLNKYSTNQAKFIRDDTDYFRVVVSFSDGVQILKDKYSNGKGLYEMYKDGNLIFSTKQNGVLSKITEVPEVIADYLGMISSDGIYLNTRSCFEPQLLTDTKGKDNYNFLNSTLKSEELSIAGTLLNTDKNKLLSEKTRYENELDIFEESAKKYDGLELESITELERLDQNLEIKEVELNQLEQVVQGYENISKIPDLPEVMQINTSQMDSIRGISSEFAKLDSIEDIPDVHEIDRNKLQLISIIFNGKNSLKEIESKLSSVELSKISSDRMNSISAIAHNIKTRREYDKENLEIQNQLDNLKVEIERLSQEAGAYNQKVLVCKNCGAVMLDSETHAH